MVTKAQATAYQRGVGVQRITPSQTQPTISQAEILAAQQEDLERQRAAEELREIEFILAKVKSKERGASFWGMDLSDREKQIIRDLSNIKGRQRATERYKELQRRYPTAAKYYDLNALTQGGTVREFGYKSPSKGLEAGQIVTIKTKDKEEMRRKSVAYPGTTQIMRKTFISQPQTTTEQPSTIAPINKEVWTGEIQPAPEKNQIREYLESKERAGSQLAGVGLSVYETGAFFGTAGKYVGKKVGRAFMLDPRVIPETAGEIKDVGLGLYSYGKEKGKRLIKGETVFPEVGEAAATRPGYITGIIGQEIVTTGITSIARTKVIPRAKGLLPVSKPIEEVSPGIRVIKDVELSKPVPTVTEIEGLGFGIKTTRPPFGGKQTEEFFTDIGIIPPKQPPKGKPPVSALKTGPYGFTTEQQAAFIGKEVVGGTTARGLITPGRTTIIRETEKGIDPITGKQAGFGGFFSPPDPKTGLPLVRESRIGDGGKAASIFDIVGAGQDVSLKGPAKPQFVFATGTVGEEFIPFGRGVAKGVPTGELELATFKRVGKDVQTSELEFLRKSGTTRVDGRRVDIISAGFVDDTAETRRLRNKITSDTKLTSSEEALIKRKYPGLYDEYRSRRGGQKATLDVSGNIFGTGRLISPTRATSLFGTSGVSGPSATSLFSSGTSVTTTRATSGISTPTSLITGRATSGISTPGTSPTTFTTTPGTPTIKRQFDLEREEEIAKNQAYKVLVKKGNKFEKVNKKKLSLSQALSLGAKVVDQTPANTFKVVPTTGKISKSQARRTDPYYRDTSFKFRQQSVSPVRKIKKALPQRTFVEKRAYRFDLGTERQLKTQASISRARKSRGNRIF